MKIGTDIIEISRIEKAIERKRFREKIYGEEELLSLPKPLSAESLAARFAAKEAVMKALGQKLPFREIQVLRKNNGAPILKLEGKALKCAEEQDLHQWEVSLSHCREYAVAFVAAY